MLGHRCRDGHQALAGAVEPSRGSIVGWMTAFAVRFTLNRYVGRDTPPIGCRDHKLIVPLMHVVVAPPTQMVPSGSRSM
jgi:hypothetical protein